MSASKLYIIATPIGNLEDLTPRAQRLLSEVDIIACEDTRRAGQLLAHFGIKAKKLISYYDPMEQKKSLELVQLLKEQNLSLALISDAGTPCIADPGYKLVRHAKEAGITVIPIPGASALTCLVSASGLPSDRVLFTGFLPRKKEELKTSCLEWKSARASIVCFEAANRLISTLENLLELYPECWVSVGRELTKMHEEIITQPISACLSWAQKHEHLKGEVVMMLDLRTETTKEPSRLDASLEQAHLLLKKGLSHKDLVEFFMLSYPDLPKKQIYEWLLKL